MSIFIVVVVIIGYILIRYIASTETRTPTGATLLALRSAYLLKPLPRLDKVKTILLNPKFKEMTYVGELFTPVTVISKGRSNPFVPFIEQAGE